MVNLLSFGIDYNGNKGFRLLRIYERLNKGELIYKAKLASEFGVSQKTIQRDIDDLRAYMVETHFTEAEVSIKFDKTRNGYFLIRYEREWLTNEEVLALSKILLESRAFQKDELNSLINKLINQVVPNDRKIIEDIIQKEYHNYTQLNHGKKLLAPIWELSSYISQNETISFEYKRQDGKVREHKVKPVAVMFSEFYFYLVTFMADDSKEYPTVFRIDRINNIKGTGLKFEIPYKDRFNDAEFRKRVQFMYSGKLNRIHFEFSGASLEAILDRLPTARILGEKDGVYTITVESYGDGVLMWLRSQGDWVNILE
ncbi:helix-turn-helix transcriptional regulator [Paenibacillus solanacearum]|uniref:helix-turn-helix transcriptional regulator n=1 Tax=Paenibacillus solanacearum TaxID=2048548 RepID=UPI001C4041BA|nr:WYL domain-containing protein [Paenibacillus solanacearum]